METLYLSSFKNSTLERIRVGIKICILIENKNNILNHNLKKKFRIILWFN